MRMFLSGSEALAHAVRLCRVDVMSAYPITPNGPTLLACYDFIRDGEMDTVSVNAESELGSMLICAGASSVGARTFNCTAAQGLALMREPLWMASGMALPVVVAVTSREIGSPQGLMSDFSDCLSERDASVLQFICEDHQEVVDSLIMAYRVSEDPRVLLPSFVVLEGFRISHSYELVEIPDQESVDRFLPRYAPKHAFVDPDYPITQGAGAFSHYYGMKHQQWRAMLEAKEVMAEACREFAQIFGRAYPGLVEAYRTEDAELVVVSAGTIVSMVRELVDEFRKKGKKVGLLKIRVFRPFPEEEIYAALRDAPHVLVVDRAVSPGRTGGVFYVEVASALATAHCGRISNYIIGGKDLETEDVRLILEEALEADGSFIKWHGELFDERASKLSGFLDHLSLAQGERPRIEPVGEGQPLIGQGRTTCAGCLSIGAIKLCMEEFDKDTVVTNNSGCLMAAVAIFPLTIFRVPHIFFTYSNAGAGASGIEVALKKLGKKMKVFLFGGDGAFFDIGLQTFSAALERGHEIVFVCYDNEAYMNTGVQRSGSTPWLAKTKTTPLGKMERKKDLMKIVMAHGNVYAATASPAYPQDLMGKVRKAKNAGRPAFIHVLCPCPSGWEYPEEKGIEIARLAVETRFFPLYEYDDGVVTVRKGKKRVPVEEYLKRQGRFSHLTASQIVEIQRYVDRQYEELLSLEAMTRKRARPRTPSSRRTKGGLVHKGS